LTRVQISQVESAWVRKMAVCHVSPPDIICNTVAVDIINNSWRPV
jgi:hypothetical protein